nr:hypothetical protein Iba_chr15aCG2160 [Ipomoea batatas]
MSSATIFWLGSSGLKCLLFFDLLPLSSSEEDSVSSRSRESLEVGEALLLCLLLPDFFFFFGLLEKLDSSRSGILFPARNPVYSSNMSSATICWLGSSGLNPPRGGLNPGFCLSSHFKGCQNSVCAKIAVKGSSLFNRLSSFGMIASFNGHSRSPL